MTLSTGGPHSQAPAGHLGHQGAGRTHTAPTPEETSVAAPSALQDGPFGDISHCTVPSEGQSCFRGAVSWQTWVDTKVQLNPRTGLILS